MSDASFVLDVTAQMTGGEQTTAQLEALSGKLVAAGVSAGTLHDAIASASNSLTASKVAALAANAALAEGNTKYKELEQAANQAAKAQEKAAKLGVVQPQVAAAATAASAALSAHEAELAKLEAAAKAATAKENALAESLTNVKKLATATAAENSKAAAAESKASSESDRNLKKLRAGLAGMGGPLGSLGAAAASSVDDFHDLTEALGSSGAVMATAGAAAGIAAAAIAVITIAVIAGTVAIAAWAVGLADANREYALTLEATEVLNPQLEKLHGTIDELGTQTGLTEQAIDGIAISLKDAHVAARDMPAALKAASLAEAALGTGGAAQFVQRMQASGKSVQTFSATVSDQLGGVVAKKLLGLTAQSGQFKQNIGTLFGGLDIEPALTGLQKLVALFDENTAAGSAIKFLFGAVFQPLINQADNAATVIEAFALGFLIGLTKVYIAVKPAIAAVEKFFGFKDASLTNTLALVTKAGEYIAPVFVVVAVVFGAVVAAVIAVVAVMALVGTAFMAPAYAVAALALAIQAALVAAVVYIASFLSSLDIVGGIRNAWSAVTQFFAGIDLSSVGSDMLQGLINGLVGAGPAVIKAISGVVGDAIGSAKALLGIHSPSKVFAEIGGYTAEGFASGVDDGADDAQSSLENLVNPSRAAGAAASAGGAGGRDGGSAGGSSGGVVLNLTINGVKDADQAVDRIQEAVTRLFESVALQAEGGAPA